MVNAITRLIVADTTNCLCFTGISKELCEVQKVSLSPALADLYTMHLKLHCMVNTLQSAADNLEELLQAMMNITREKLQARDISYATDLLERLVEVPSFHNVEVFNV